MWGQMRYCSDISEQRQFIEGFIFHMWEQGQRKKAINLFYTALNNLKLELIFFT